MDIETIAMRILQQYDLAKSTGGKPDFIGMIRTLYFSLSPQEQHYFPSVSNFISQVSKKCRDIKPPQKKVVSPSERDAQKRVSDEIKHCFGGDQEFYYNTIYG